MRSLYPTENKTWVEVDRKAVESNYKVFRRLVEPSAKIFAVVKSNAYGHGLLEFSGIVDEMADGFCVDSVAEAVALRESGIKKTILVLGFSMPEEWESAYRSKTTISISNLTALKALREAKNIPDFHLKIDTGMRRQGFYPDGMASVARLCSMDARLKRSLKGVFTHFSSAKDINYPTFSDNQLDSFMTSVRFLEAEGFNNLIRHVAATGGTMISPKYHLDAVRIGIGLYGLWPSKELEIQLGDKIKLKPALKWKAIVAEMKEAKMGDYVGYDLVERLTSDASIAVIPVGYWHGIPRSLSGVGDVMIKGRKARILGRVSMDMVVVDVTGIPVKFGDEVSVIYDAADAARRFGGSHYELVTRINPSIKRVIV
ncbi:MAG: alanine racemase [Candidatus Colwellbacteria bacterium]|nr:alanine racemase [Candidatus Colwellbacteria bacterium]